MMSSSEDQSILFRSRDARGRESLVRELTAMSMTAGRSVVIIEFAVMDSTRASTVVLERRIE